MKFLDKVKNLGTVLTQTTQDLNQAYKDKGVDGIIDKAEKGLDTLSTHANSISEKSVAYVKEVYDENRKLVKEISKDESLKESGTINKTVSLGVAATLHTTNRLKEDLLAASKELYKNWIEDDNLIDKVGVPNPERQAPEMRKEPIHNNLEIDNTPLSKLLKMIEIRKVRGQTDQFKDKLGNALMIKDQMWYCKEKNISGVGAISLMSFHLSLVTGVDYHNENNKKMLNEEAINILEQFQVRIKNEEEKPIVAKKRVKKIS